MEPQQLTTLLERTARIEERQVAMDEKLDLHLEGYKDHEGRLRVLEKFKGRVVGGLLLLSAPLVVWFLIRIAEGAGK